MNRTNRIWRFPAVVGATALVFGLSACGPETHSPADPDGSGGSGMGSEGGAGGAGSGSGGTGSPSTGGKGGSTPSGSGGNSGTGGSSGTGGGSGTGGSNGTGGTSGTTGTGGTVAMGGAGGRVADAAAGMGGRGGSAPGTDAGGGDRPPTVTPPTGPTLIVNGQPVPKEKLVAFIHLGHSDMMGRATTPASLDSYFHGTDPHLWMYRKGGMWLPAKESTAGNPSTTQTGPGMAILRTALSLAPDSHMVSIGRGSSGPFCLEYRKSANTGFYKEIMDRAIELKGKVTWGGIFTMLHITEYHTSTAEQMKFADCLVGLAEEIRADLGDPNIPLMVGGWTMGAQGQYAPDSPTGKICIPQIAMVPSKTKNAAVISTQGFAMQDDHHLNRESHKKWAESGFAIMKMNGWVPWAQ